MTEGDFVTFEVSVFDDGKVFDLSNASRCVLLTVKPDGSVTAKDGKVTGVNKVTFVLGYLETSIVGKIKSIIQVYDLEGRVSSFPFNFVVKNDPSKDYVSQSPDTPLLQTLINDTTNLLMNIKQDHDYTKKQGDYAKEQGDYAKAQGDYAKEQGDYAKAQGDYVHAQGLLIDNLKTLGEYDASVTYKKNNIVRYNGSSYIAKQTTVGNPPTDTTYWELLAQRGVDGKGSVSSVNNISPDANGNITLTATDVGASPSNHTHQELHTHSNKVVLDGLRDSNGKLLYKGAAIGSVASVNGQTGTVTLTATDVGAETPSGAQAKADQAERKAKEHANRFISPHLSDNTRHITSEERTYWNNKLSVHEIHKTVYVSVNGNNGNNGSINSPLRDIQYALNQCPKYLTASYEIVLLNGFYNEDVEISSFSGVNVTIRGETEDSTKASIKSLKISNNTAKIVVKDLSVSYFNGIAGVYIENCNDVRLTNVQQTRSDESKDGLFAANSLVYVKNSTLSGNRRAIVSSEGSTIISENNAGYDNIAALCAEYGGIIVKVNGMQPNGSTSELTIHGGIIR